MYKIGYHYGHHSGKQCLDCCCNDCRNAHIIFFSWRTTYTRRVYVGNFFAYFAHLRFLVMSGFDHRVLLHTQCIYRDCPLCCMFVSQWRSGVNYTPGWFQSCTATPQRIKLLRNMYTLLTLYKLEV
jgi:hypothetical protein